MPNKYAVVSNCYAITPRHHTTLRRQRQLRTDCIIANGGSTNGDDKACLDTPMMASYSVLVCVQRKHPLDTICMTSIACARDKRPSSIQRLVVCRCATSLSSRHTPEPTLNGCLSFDNRLLGIPFALTFSVLLQTLCWLVRVGGGCG